MRRGEGDLLEIAPLVRAVSYDGTAALALEREERV
jgi:hypothetical protein